MSINDAWYMPRINSISASAARRCSCYLRSVELKPTTLNFVNVHTSVRPSSNDLQLKSLLFDLSSRSLQPASLDVSPVYWLEEVRWIERLLTTVWTSMKCSFDFEFWAYFGGRIRTMHFVTFYDDRQDSCFDHCSVMFAWYVSVHVLSFQF